MTPLKAMTSKRWAQTTIGCLLLVFVAAAVGGNAIGPRAVSAFARQADGVLDLLRARSPGTREVGELTKLKHRAEKLVGAPTPEQRALGKVFPGKPRPGSQPGILDDLPFPLIVSDDQDLLSLPLFALEAVPPPGAGPVFSQPGPGAGGFILPPGGGSAVSPPTGTPLPQEPEVPAVPEPSTWTVLIVGFAMCAFAMRRRKASTPTAFGLPCDR